MSDYIISLKKQNIIDSFGETGCHIFWLAFFIICMPVDPQQKKILLPADFLCSHNPAAPPNWAAKRRNVKQELHFCTLFANSCVKK